MAALCAASSTDCSWVIPLSGIPGGREGYSFTLHVLDFTFFPATCVKRLPQDLHCRMGFLPCVTVLRAPLEIAFVDLQ
jgi:hypothetical protein